MTSRNGSTPGATPPFDDGSASPNGHRPPRFRPARAGIVNLWQYDEQTFDLHNGRLILRGENAAGKSKALELLLPFLLDADLAPHRLDPFGGQAKTMRWNLLENGIHDARAGYAWLEFGREEPGGTDAVVTVGAGVYATASSTGVDSWYFVTSKRVGTDLNLVEPDGVPLRKDALRRALGDDGHVYDTGREYRQSVDRELFGLGAERYRALVDLLLRLRQPKLSAHLNPDELSRLLTRSLPPLDDDIVARLSDGFESLEREQRELGALRAAARAVDAFLVDYRVYARGASRMRASALRQADWRVREAAQRLRETTDALSEAQHALRELAEAIDATDRLLGEARGVVRALESSPEMRTVEGLRHAERLAQQAQAALAKASGALDEAKSDTAMRESRAESAERERQAKAARASEAGDVAAEAAQVAGLEDVHAGARPPLVEDADAGRKARERVVDARLAAVRELRLLRRALDEARAVHAREEDRRRDADDRTRILDEAAASALRACEEQEAALDEAVLDWAGGLGTLALNEAEFAPLRAYARGAGLDETADPQRILSIVAAPQRESAMREVALLDTRVNQLQHEMAELHDEIVAFERGAAEGPAPQRTRTPRDGRPGAPLWLLCDFRKDLSDADRAGLEAALEASGLLDAWVTPSGDVLSQDTLDVVLVPGALDGLTTLAEVLEVTPAGGVPERVVSDVLRSVALGADGEYRVDLDGSFRLGPLHGRWKKDAPEHVGAAAREEARLRRLAALRDRHSGLEASAAAASADRDAAAERRASLEREIAAFPTTTELARLRAKLAAAEDQTSDARAGLEAAERRALARRLDLEEAEQALFAAADSGGLRPFVDELDEHERAIADYRRALGELVSVLELASVATTAAKTAQEELKAATGRLACAYEDHAEALKADAETSGELETLRQTVGAKVDQILARLADANDRVLELDRQLKSLHASQLDARDMRGRADGKAAGARDELSDRTNERSSAVDGVRRLAAAGLLEYALDPLSPDDPDAWTATRALEIARAVEQACDDAPSTSEGIDDAANATFRQFNVLRQELASDFRPSIEQPDGLLVVRVGHNAREHTVASLREVLRGEEEQRRTLLEQHERDLLERFLLGEVGTHLRSRLGEARELVDDMNAQLRERPTASGMTISLRWDPDPDSGDATQRAVALLRRDIRLLPDADQDALTRFLQERIREAHDRIDAGTWREHLADALDYRRWHRFRTHKTQDGRTTVLTQREHAAGSGGEKSVALHLPLFAAAAAHYRSARADAPRLVLLDEAFAGIDAEMRGRCFGLLVAFDLDFVMTSEQEWGTHVELPGVAIYHLARDPALRGVAAEKFVWNGERLVGEDAT